MYCSRCGSQLPPSLDDNKCPNCGAEIYTKKSYLVLRIASLLFPILGFVLYFVYRKDNQDKADKVKAAAWAGVVINLVLYYLGTP